MPSASTKVEKSTSLEGEQSLKQVMILLEKKVRNLEKRKGKLDTYKGKELNEDQKLAVAKYDEVLQMLDFAREVQKTVNQSIQDSQKMLKKQARRDLLERQQQEILRVKEMLVLQNLLENMRNDDVKDDFTIGKNGAFALEPEKLNRLEEFSKLVSLDKTEFIEPTLYQNHLASASEHLVLLLDAKNKEIVGSTYKELKELLMSINMCKYFDKDRSIDCTEPENEVETVTIPENNSTEEIHDANIEIDVAIVETAPQTEKFVANPSQQTTEQPMGNFNFLQDSQIDLESPHMDPAVVEARPMAPLSQGLAAGATYPHGNALDGISHNQESMMQGQTQPHQVSDNGDGFKSNQPIPSQTFTNQSFNSSLPQTFNSVQNAQNKSGTNQETQSNGAPLPIPMNAQGNIQDQSNFAPPHLKEDPMIYNQSVEDSNEMLMGQGQDNSASGYKSQGNRPGYNNRSGNRPRGSRGGFRGRGASQNGRGGNGYQGPNRENYQSSNNSNSRESYRGNRGTGRGGPRGGRGGSRGGPRGGYNKEQQ